MPLQGSHVIHPRWSQHHRPVATGAMTATCTVTHGTGTGTTDAAGEYVPPAQTTFYTGACRVSIATSTNERIEIVGEGQETRRRYQVWLENGAAEPPIGALVNITACPQGSMTGKKLQVVDTRLGSEQWQETLMTEELEA